MGFTRLLALAAFLAAPARALTPAQRRRNLDVLCSEVRRRSTRLESKGVPWDELCERARARVGGAAGDAEFYLVLFRLVAGLRDSHTFLIGFPYRYLQYGVGASARCEGPRAYIAEIVDGSPADRNGLRPGDEVLAVDGRTVAQAEEDRRAFLPGSSSEAAARLESCERLLQSNEEGPAEISIRRGGAGPAEPARIPRTMGVPPRVGPPAMPPGSSRSGAVAWTMLPSGIGWIRFLDFRDRGGSAFDGYRQALAALSGAHGFVFDLRGNGGGYGAAPRRIAAALPSAPIVALIDETTQSAAELFATYLEKRGTPFVGAPTGGLLGGNDDEIALPCGLRLRLERGDVRGRDGRPVDGRGVQPDIRVVESEDDRRRGIDRPLEAAIAKLVDGGSASFSSGRVSASPP